MNPETLAKKLQSLMPEVVGQWLRSRELADPELKSLIDKQIVSTAYKTFGDFHNKILLSLPPENKAKGSIYFGTIIYDKEKWPAGISKDELLQNVGIYGRSGSGKTTLAFHLIQQLDSMGIPYLFFDHKRTLRHLLPQLKNKVNVFTPGRSLSKLIFNPFITPPGIESSVYINQLVDVMATAFTLGDGAMSVIQKAIFKCYQSENTSPSAQDIILEIEKLELKGRSRDWKLSAIRALETIAFSIDTSDNVSQEQMAQRLIQENTVIELDGLSDGVHQFLVPLLYQWIYQVKLISPEREKLSMVVFLDEAHTIMSNQIKRSSESLMEKLLRLTRELGIATVILDQTPSMISKVVLANCYTNIFLNLASYSDLQKAASICLLDPDEKKYFSKLPIGQGIVKLQDRWTSPFLVKFPPVKVEKGFVTDAVLQRYFSVKDKILPGSGRKTFMDTYFRQVPQIPLLDIALNEPALQFLYDIIQYPDDGVKSRYTRLGISIGSGNRTKEVLLSQGWVEAQVVELNQTRKLLLKLTIKAQDALGVETGAEYGSLVHEYWKRFYAQKYRDLGCRVDMEVPRKTSGRVDIVAKKDGQTIAIEVETGKSDFISNIRQDLRSKYSRIIVVATDKAAFEKIERALLREGLLIDGKVEIVVEGNLLRG